MREVVKTDKKRRPMRGGSLRGVGAAGAGVPEGAGRVLDAAAGGAGLGVGGEREAVGEDQRAGGGVVPIPIPIPIPGRVGVVRVAGVGSDEVLGGGEVSGVYGGRARLQVAAGG